MDGVGWDGVRWVVWWWWEEGEERGEEGEGKEEEKGGEGGFATAKRVSTKRAAHQQWTRPVPVKT